MFGHIHLIGPQVEIVDMLKEKIKNINLQSWMFHCYQKFLRTQKKQATKDYKGFKPLVQVLHPVLNIVLCIYREVPQNCDMVLSDMACPEYSKRIDKERKNQTRINKQYKEEFLNYKLPDPNISLPKYYEHHKVRKFVDDTISEAEDKDARVTGDEISRKSNFVLEYIILNSCMRIKVPENMSPTNSSKVSSLAKESLGNQIPW